MARNREREFRYFSPAHGNVTHKRPSRLTAIALLTCDCHIKFPLPAPKVGDLVWCTRHHDVRVVSVDAEWRVKCRDCRYSRPFGAAELTAMTAGSKHGLIKRHTVDVYRGGKRVHTVGGELPGQIDLDSLEEPPF